MVIPLCTLSKCKFIRGGVKTSILILLQRSVPIPATMWTLRGEPRRNETDSVWAVFKSHEEVSDLGS